MRLDVNRTFRDIDIDFEIFFKNVAMQHIDAQPLLCHKASQKNLGTQVAPSGLHVQSTQSCHVFPGFFENGRTQVAVFADHSTDWLGVGTKS